MNQFLRDITVHRMVIIVLIIISALFITLSALSLISLNNASKELKTSHAALQKTQALAQVNDQLMRARLRLNRLVEHQAAGNEEAQHEESMAAEAALAGAAASFNKFMQHADSNDPIVKQLEEQYQALSQGGLSKLVQMLKNGDITQARQHNIHTVIEASRQFGNTITTFSSQADQQHQAMLADAQRNRTWMTIALGIVLLAFIGLTLLADRYIVYFVRTPLDKVKEYFQQIADGDLTIHIEPFGKNCPGQIYPYLIDMKDSLAGTVRSVREGVEQINNGTSEIASGNHDLSRRTEQQAASLEETASSMEELSETVAQNADHARTASSMMQNVAAVASRGESAMDKVVSIMQEINAKSRQIEEITGLIDGIAFQTNILALNAAVEAARAGEQGKGFAVVAQEVRNLAQRSANAAKEIKTLIISSGEVVNNGTQQVTTAGETIHEVTTSVNQVATLIEEIANASREQATGISQVKIAITLMDEATQQNSALVEEAAATASALDDQANNLRQAVQIFKVA